MLIVGTLAFIVYSRYSKNDSQNPPIANETDNSTTDVVDNNSNNVNVVDNEVDNNNATTTSPNPIKLTEEQVISPILFFDGQGVVFLTPDGQFYKANFAEENGKIVFSKKDLVEIEPRKGIVKILWPKEGKDFIVEFQNNGKKTWSLFSYDVGAYMDLPEKITWLDWMPDGKQIMYLWLDNGKTTLNISDADTKNWQEIAQMWENDNAIAVSPDAKNILFYRTQNNEMNNKLTMVSSDGKLWQDMVREGYVYGVLWSPDGKKFLFGKKERSTLKYQLWVYDIFTGEVRNLGFFTTPDKAVWDPSGQYIYVAVPNTGTAGSSQLTKDTFYKMDLQTFEKKEYPMGSLEVDGRDLLVSSSNKYLFFKNAHDGALYYFSL